MKHYPTSNKPVWYRYYARILNIPTDEADHMTPGEVRDLLNCRAIASGSYREIISEEAEISAMLALK